MVDFLQRYKNTTISISKQFAVISCLGIAAIVLFGLIFSWFGYQSRLEEKHETLQFSAQKIGYIVTDSIQYIENYAEFIGRRIADSGADDLSYIATLMGSDANASPNAQNFYISTLFDWVTPDKKLRVSSKTGILDTPIDLSYRNYLNDARRWPWSLQTQAPSIGAVSKQWIIPGGMGVTNGAGSFLGTVTFGITVNGLTEKINKVLSKADYAFLLIHKSNVVISTNNSTHSSTLPTPLSQDALHQLEAMASKSGYLDKPIYLAGNTYHYFYKPEKHDIHILTGYPEGMASRMFLDTFLARNTSLGIIGGILIVIILLLRRKVIEPINALHNFTKELLDGTDCTTPPRSNIYEIRQLRHQLLRTKHLLNQKRRHKTALASANERIEEALRVIKESKRAREKFTRQLRQEIIDSVDSAIAFSKAIMHNEGGRISKTHRDMAQEVHKNCSALFNFSTQQLQLSAINVRNLVEQSILFYRGEASIRNIQISTDIEEDLPPLLADPVRFRQIIAGTLNQALDFTPENEQIFIAASKRIMGNNHSELVITIKDTGFGLDESYRQRTLERTVPEEHNRHIDGTDLSIPHIKHLVSLHCGSFEIDTKYKDGTVFTIILPYLDCNQAKQPQSASKEAEKADS